MFFGVVTDELNESVKCEVRQSAVHGVGVFAIRDIRKGEVMNCRERKRLMLVLQKEDFDKLYPEVRDVILKRWPIAFEGQLFLHPNSDAYLISFMNCSNGGYINYDENTDTALKDILKGEEVFSDYHKYKDFLLKIK